MAAFCASVSFPSLQKCQKSCLQLCFLSGWYLQKPGAFQGTRFLTVSKQTAASSDPPTIRLPYLFLLFLQLLVFFSMMSLIVAPKVTFFQTHTKHTGFQPPFILKNSALLSIFLLFESDILGLMLIFKAKGVKFFFIHSAGLRIDFSGLLWHVRPRWRCVARKETVHPGHLHLLYLLSPGDCLTEILLRHQVNTLSTFFLLFFFSYPVIEKSRGPDEACSRAVSLIRLT